MRGLPLTITLAAGCLGWCCADWQEAQGGAGWLFAGRGEAPSAGPRTWPPAHVCVDFEAALASQDQRPLVVYGRMNAPHIRAFEAAAAASPEVEAALAGVRITVVDVDGPMPRELASAGLLTAVPALVAVRFRGRAHVFEAADAVEPLTGATLEPIGLAAELERIAAGRETLDDLSVLEPSIEEQPPERTLALVARLEATGHFRFADQLRRDALAAEARPNGPLHRDALLRAALAAHVRPDAPDAEGGPIEQHLIEEADRGTLYRGWSLLASSFAAFADTREDPDVAASARAVQRERWLRRVRRAARKAYRPCPDARLVPFASLVLERFALDPEDIDSIDRSFCRAVARRIEEEAPDSPWAARARELFPPR